MKLKIFTDGGSRGNPGDAGIGIVVYNNTEVIYEFSGYIGTATNNEAEYQAVVKALEWVEENKKDISELDFFLDSKLVVEQLNKNWKIKEPRMHVFAQNCWELITKLDFNPSFTHVKREKNKEADALVNQALDAHQA